MKASELGSVPVGTRITVPLEAYSDATGELIWCKWNEDFKMYDVRVLIEGKSRMLFMGPEAKWELATDE